MDELIITPWSDSLIERLGHDPTSSYVETYWLPIIGPTGTWMYRRFGQWVALQDEVTLDVDAFARSIGVGGKRPQFDRTIQRLVTFHAARWNGGVLEVRRKLPTLTARLVAHLPHDLRHRHASDLVGRSTSDRLVTA